ncbi:MAG: carboxylating nicotinate-nucleotide diphosphorylase [Ignavibacteria bacterium]
MFNEQELNVIDTLIETALREDIASGDITTNSLIDENETASGYLLAKVDGIIAGLNVAEMVFKKLDDNFEFTPLVKEGETVKSKTKIAELKGNLRALLTGERTALNFLQRVSGIASETQRYVHALEGSNTKILDTRKTVPGFRLLDKYAVKMGGGTNHRIGLYDMVMIKDNHIKAAGTITKAVEKARANISEAVKIEVETTNLKEVKEALNAEVDIIMLDNMETSQMAKAVEMVNGMAKIEASGSMHLQRIKEVAETGVDYISVGALTHSVKALDIGQYIL